MVKTIKSCDQLMQDFDSRFYAESITGTFLENKIQSLPSSDAVVYENPFKPTEFEHAAMRHARLRRNVGVAAKLHSVSINGGKKYRNFCMVTLTYREDTWEPSDIRQYITHVRNWLARRCGQVLRYIWVAEMQKRGVIHYHCLFFMPKGVTMPKADKQGWWPHGSTRTERAVAPVNYVMKYASKFDSKAGFPKGARTYAIGGLDETSCNSRRWLNLPSFIKARASISDKWRRAVGGGWLEQATGEVWPSEWGVCLASKLKVAVIRLRNHGRPLDVAGPFEWIDRKPVLA